MPLRQPEREAFRLLERFDLLIPPIDVVAIAERQGVYVAIEQMDPAVSGLLVRDHDATYIGVNGDQPEGRQRFTIAHELGHLAMHPGRPVLLDTTLTRVNWRDDTSERADREEIEANQFAAGLLMPASLVRHQMALVTRSAGHPLLYDDLHRSLAETFKVSMEAMAFRLVGLGLHRTS